MRAAFVLCLAIGCGDNDQITIATSADNLCQQIAEVACHDMFACCTESQIEQTLGVTNPRTELECRGDFARQCRRTIAPYAIAVADHRVAFDGKVMDTCLRELVAPDGVCISVEAELPWKLACMESAWVGEVATGGSCHFAFECAGHDSVCAPNETCRELPGAFQACSPVLPCASNFYCGADRFCHPDSPSGSPCALDSQCLKGLYCEVHEGLPFCAPLHGKGEPCNGSNSCTSQLCLTSTCTVSQNPCFVDTDCSFASFCTGTHTPCNQDIQCAPGTCVPDACVGTATCGEDQIVVDYCATALANLPIPVPQ